VTTYGHGALLTLARATEVAARATDRDRLEAATLRLFEALVEHLAAEHPELLRLAPGDARRVAHGQQRVVESVVDLAAAAASRRADGDCRCPDLAQHVIARLAVQSDDERHWFFPEHEEDDNHARH
jgi:hypothetical protein